MNQGNPSRRSRIRQESNASARGALIPPSPRHNRCARTRRFSNHATIVLFQRPLSGANCYIRCWPQAVLPRAYATASHRRAEMGACPEHRSHEN